MGLLSGGQRQAVSLLMARPDTGPSILLLDEHTALRWTKPRLSCWSLTQNIIAERNSRLIGHPPAMKKKSKALGSKASGTRDGCTRAKWCSTLPAKEPRERIGVKRPTQPG